MFVVYVLFAHTKKINACKNFVPTLIISSFFNIFKKQKEISFAWRQNQNKKF